MTQTSRDAREKEGKKERKWLLRRVSGGLTQKRKWKTQKGGNKRL